MENMADPHRPPSHLILPSNCTDSTIQKIQNELTIEGVEGRTFFIEEDDGTYIRVETSLGSARNGPTVRAILAKF